MERLKGEKKICSNFGNNLNFESCYCYFHEFVKQWNINDVKQKSLYNWKIIGQLKQYVIVMLICMLIGALCHTNSKYTRSIFHQKSVLILFARNVSWSIFIQTFKRRNLFKRTFSQIICYKILQNYHINYFASHHWIGEKTCKRQWKKWKWWTRPSYRSDHNSSNLYLFSLQQ